MLIIRGSGGSKSQNPLYVSKCTDLSILELDALAPKSYNLPHIRVIGEHTTLKWGRLMVHVCDFVDLVCV